MIGDIINIRKEYFVTANEIATHYWGSKTSSIKVIAVGGESGSGKSVTAVCLSSELKTLGMNSLILHMDDYYVLPPASNHYNRLKNIDSVGPNEVRMDLLQSHIDQFLKGEAGIEKPLINYRDNSIMSEKLSLEGINILIIEGTYSLLLNRFDLGIFMSRNYLETKENRMSRGREEWNDFIEQVLEIEHKIVVGTETKAQVIIQKDYSVKFVL